MNTESQTSHSRHISRKRSMCHVLFLIVHLLLLSAVIVLGTVLNIQCTNITHLNLTNTTDVTPTSTIPNFNKFFAFTPDPSYCLEKHIVPLGSDVFVSVCSPKDRVIIDIRYFEGTNTKGLYPGKRGISLSLSQMKKLMSYKDTIMSYVKHVQSSITDLP